MFVDVTTHIARVSQSPDHPISNKIQIRITIPKTLPLRASPTVWQSRWLFPPVLFWPHANFQLTPGLAKIADDEDQTIF